MNKYLTTFLQHKSTPFLTFFLVLIYLIIYAAYIIIPPVRNPESITYFLAALSVHSIIAALLWNTLRTTMPSLLLLALLFFVPRMILFPMLPWLSDDVFGYLWYGHVTVHGMNPFEANADSPDQRQERLNEKAMNHQQRAKAVAPIVPVSKAPSGPDAQAVVRNRDAYAEKLRAAEQRRQEREKRILEKANSSAPLPPTPP